MVAHVVRVGDCFSCYIALEKDTVENAYVYNYLLEDMLYNTANFNLALKHDCPFSEDLFVVHYHEAALLFFLCTTFLFTKAM